MEAGGALCEIRKCLGRAFLVTKNVQIDFGWFGTRLGNAAAAEFDVAFKLVWPDHVALDASLDVGNLIEQIGRRALWINKRLMLPQEFISQLPTAADSARFD